MDIFLDVEMGLLVCCVSRLTPWCAYFLLCWMRIPITHWPTRVLSRITQGALCVSIVCCGRRGCLSFLWNFTKIFFSIIFTPLISTIRRAEWHVCLYRVMKILLFPMQFHWFYTVFCSNFSTRCFITQVLHSLYRQRYPIMHAALFQISTYHSHMYTENTMYEFR